MTIIMVWLLVFYLKLKTKEKPKYSISTSIGISIHYLLSREVKLKA